MRIKKGSQSPRIKIGANNMADEEKDKGQGNPPPASGEKPQGENPPANAGEKAEETEALKKTLGEKEELLKEKETQLGQAGFKIQDLKRKLKEAGVDEEEEKLGEDKVRNIVQETVKTELEKATKDLNIKISELGRTIASKQNLGGGGDAGQKPPLEILKPEPALSDVDRKLINHMGAKWDPQKGAYITKRGKIIDLKSTEGIASGAEIPPSA